MDENKIAFSSYNAIKNYTNYSTLQRGEVSVFKKFNSKIVKGKILDIGIGAGRTTTYLSAIAREYWGIDYSQSFVEHCKMKFSDKANVTIRLGDARKLIDFKNAEFDFILFSFNGIDYVDLNEREQILNELRRVINDEGVVCFSFHNKRNIDRLYSFQLPKNPFKYLMEWKRAKKVRKINGPKENYKSMDWFIIKDGGENFTVNTFYIDPVYQKKYLEKIGFKNFYFYDAVLGIYLNEQDLKNSETPWIYVCATF